MYIIAVLTLLISAAAMICSGKRRLVRAGAVFCVAALAIAATLGFAVEVLREERFYSIDAVLVSLWIVLAGAAILGSAPVLIVLRPERRHKSR